MGSGSRFLRDSTVERLGAGRYRGGLTGEWNAPVIPQGGYVTATALRAMADELGDEAQRLRSVTTVFAAPVLAGDVDIDVQVLREGRSMSQLMATVRNPGDAAGHTTLAVFGAVRDGFEFTDLDRPEAPAPDECPSFRDPPPDDVDFERIPMTFWEHVEGRSVVGHAPWEQWDPTGSERIYWYRFDEPPMLDDGRHDPFALVALCDTMPGAVGERMGPGHPRWVPPSADFTAHLFADTSSEWILVRNRARHAGEGYASVELELWDPAGTLLACATQVMFFQFPDGPPARDRRQAPPLAGR